MSCTVYQFNCVGVGCFESFQILTCEGNTYVALFYDGDQDCMLNGQIPSMPPNSSIGTWTAVGDCTPATPTPTPTPTETTPPPTETPTPTPTPTATTPPPTETPTPTATTPPPTETPTPTPTPTATTPPPTTTPTGTPTPTPTATTPPPTSTPTPTPTATTPPPTSTPTSTPTATTLPPTNTPTPTPTATTPPPTSTPTPTPTETGAPTFTPTPTVTPTPTPLPAPIPNRLLVYTPWVYSNTAELVWLQAIYPPNANYNQYTISWGDNIETYTTDTNISTDAYFLHNYTVPTEENIYYSIVATANTLSGDISRFVFNRINIKNTTPTYSTEGFYNPVTDTNILPYSLEQVKVGSNEWVTADVINASLNKLNSNFTHLLSTSRALQINNYLNLIEWCPNLYNNPYPVTTSVTYGAVPSASNWRTNIDGINADYFNYAVSAIGTADGIIKDIKSYRFTNSSAPDYYTYIIFSSNGSIPDHYQIRYNNFQNQLVLSAVNLSDNFPSFTCLSAIDVINNNLYILDNQTIYKVIFDAQLENTNVINQVGGVSGLRTDNNNFNTPTEIKAYNDRIYVSDSNNSCIKVYNESLSWVKTLYTDILSAYSIKRIEINKDNGNVFALGQTFAPVAPIITNVQSVTATGQDRNIYTITFAHDGLRLLNNTSNSLSAFSLYGLVSGGSNYIELTSAVMASATPTLPYYGSIQTITYVASAFQYSDFKIKALGENNFNSEYSNNIPTPSNFYFTSPYKFFEINYDTNTVVNSFTVPAIFSDRYERTGNILSTDNIVKILIDPTGSFLYVLTNNYIYKYLTTGEYLIRFEFPSKASLGNEESIRTGFIDDRLNFFVATDKRIFKFIDLPVELKLYNTNIVDSLFAPLSAILIQENEFVQDWVYNKGLLKLIQNHQILYKAIKNKFYIYLNKDGFLTFPTESRAAFGLGVLSATDIDNPYIVTHNNFIHSNEIVAASVVNRVLEQIYNFELSILDLITPRVFKELPTGDNNIINPLSGIIDIPPVTSISFPLTWTLNISANGPGTVYPNGSVKVFINQPAVIQALSDTGSTFNGWTGDNMTKLTLLTTASGGSFAKIEPGIDYASSLNYIAAFTP